jgi:uncharacterized protein (TIGR02246 family)
MPRAPRLSQVLNFFLALAVLPAGLTAQGSPTGDSKDANTKADKEAIRALLKEASAAHRAGDAERWTAVFTNDAVIMAPNQPAVSGRAAVLRFGQERFKKFTSTAEIKPVEIEVCGDWAFARTAVSGTFTPKDGGPPIELDLKEIAIYRRQPDGTWKVARLIGNSNRPPAQSQKSETPKS